MNPDIFIVFATLLTAAVMFVTNGIRNDLVALLVVLAMMLSGVLTVRESLAGFSDPVVMIVISMFIIGEAVVYTGIARKVGELIIRYGGTSETRLMIMLMVAAGLLGSFVSSTATIAIFIPVTMAVAEKAGLNHRRLLMPLSVGAMVSGMMTLIATTPNIVIADVLADKGFDSFSFFSFTPFGLLIMSIAILFMVLFGKNMLAKKSTAVLAKQDRTIQDMAREYGLHNQLTRLQISPSSPLIDRSVARVQLIKNYGLKLIAIEKREMGRRVIQHALPETVFNQGDIILLVGEPENSARLVTDYSLKKLQIVANKRRRKRLFQAVGLVEVMLTPDSKLIGQSLKGLQFQSRFNCLVLGIRRKREPITSDFDDLPLQFGDVLLLNAGWDDLVKLRNYHDNFLLLTMPRDYREVIPGQKQAPFVLAIIGVMVVMMVLKLLPTVTVALLAALTLILGKCIRLNGVYQVINWQTVVLIAGILPLVTALNKTGAAHMVSLGLVQVMGPFGPLPILALLFIVTSVIGLFLSNTPTAVLIAPIAIDTAMTLGISPHAFAMTVAIACSAGFSSPLSAPANMLVQEPGGYSFLDYIKVGIPLQLLALIVTVGLAWLIYL
ncbi:MAG: SLC13 family permease [Thermodesulfobacteriota bacterium]|nr:SLC13 family permease [Thermodesulfobacteriota bacterium]